MAANLITFDSEYMREYAKTVEKAQNLVDEARASLRKANRHDGWRCSERRQVNDSLDDISTKLGRISNGLRETSSSLVKGAGQFADLESRAQREESAASGQLKKNWLFEAQRWVAGVIGAVVEFGQKTGFLPVTQVPSHTGRSVTVSPNSPYIDQEMRERLRSYVPAEQTPPPEAQPTGPKEISSPDFSGAGYSEYRNGFTDKNGKTWRFQCVGYTKGRLSEALGITIPVPWGNGGDVASNLNEPYAGTTVTGTDGSYEVEYCDLNSVKAHSLASFGPSRYSDVGHVLYVEDVWEENGTTWVRYSEANTGGTDGLKEPVTLEEFKNLPGGLKDSIHFEKV